jgi:hypothetical protein
MSHVSLAVFISALMIGPALASIGRRRYAELRGYAAGGRPGHVHSGMAAIPDR